MPADERVPNAPPQSETRTSIAALMQSAAAEDATPTTDWVFAPWPSEAVRTGGVWHEPKTEPQPARKRGPARILRQLRSVCSLSARFVLVLLVIYGLLFNFSVVRGSSMSPSIFDGDRILIDHFSYLFTEVSQGDIVVLQYPLDPRLDYIKRVIGVPGDEVVIENGRVFVNDEPLDEEYVDVPDLSSRMQTYVMKGHYFVLGDNRCHSSDSREFGQVPAENLRGKVDLRVWPLGRIGLIH